jgi:hypothetical protein
MKPIAQVAAKTIAIRLMLLCHTCPKFMCAMLHLLLKKYETRSQVCPCIPHYF